MQFLVNLPMVLHVPNLQVCEENEKPVGIFHTQQKSLNPSVRDPYSTPHCEPSL